MVGQWGSGEPHTPSSAPQPSAPRPAPHTPHRPLSSAPQPSAPLSSAPQPSAPVQRPIPAPLSSIPCPAPPSPAPPSSAPQPSQQSGQVETHHHTEGKTPRGR
ncbi:unnamed protein product [Coregonus sp. 'balchen']|nr:unnamed protein product [Coregonus sp. 'balchen']